MAVPERSLIEVTRMKPAGHIYVFLQTLIIHIQNKTLESKLTNIYHSEWGLPKMSTNLSKFLRENKQK